MKPGVKSALKKLIVALVVGLGLLAASYFGFEVSEKDITDVISPIIEEVIEDTAAPVTEPAPAQ